MSVAGVVGIIKSLRLARRWIKPRSCGVTLPADLSLPMATPSHVAPSKSSLVCVAPPLTDVTSLMSLSRRCWPKTNTYKKSSRCSLRYTHLKLFLFPFPLAWHGGHEVLNFALKGSPVLPLPPRPFPPAPPPPLLLTARAAKTLLHPLRNSLSFLGVRWDALHVQLCDLLQERSRAEAACDGLPKLCRAQAV